MRGETLDLSHGLCAPQRHRDASCLANDAIKVHTLQRMNIKLPNLKRSGQKRIPKKHIHINTLVIKHTLVTSECPEPANHKVRAPQKIPRLWNLHSG